MINKGNFQYYLRYLAKLTDDNPLLYDEIPQPFYDFFSFPGLTESINIKIRTPLPANWSNVEKYFDCHTFSDFNSLVEGIKTNFQNNIDKLYAIYYYITHHVQYDWERFLLKKREHLSIDQIFTLNKGICCDYSIFFIQLAKKVGITNKIIPIYEFSNTSKGHGYDPLDPPKEPNHNHACVFVEIDDEPFLSEPTWGAGSIDDNGNFTFSYEKFSFLIPYYIGCLTHYPDNPKLVKYNYPFSFKHFTSLNKGSLEKELAFESNPFVEIQVEDGYYEMQFSFVQTTNRISCDLQILNGKEWLAKDSFWADFTCLEKDIPGRSYTYYPEEKRSRYKMSICFPENGKWTVIVYGDGKFLFKSFYSVKGAKNQLRHIPGCGKIEARFYPIVPREGLTKVDKGFARIRFAVKMKRSPLLISLFKVTKGTLKRESENPVKKFCTNITTYLPFDYSTEEKEDENDKLVEDWLLVDFPENGLWEVYIYFKNDDIDYSHGVTYYFDVSGAGSCKRSQLFDIPKSISFVPFKTTSPEKVWTEPSSSVVILNEFDFYFHVFSENKLDVYFIYDGEEKQSNIWPTLITEKETSKNNIVDREYSVTFTKYGSYQLNLWGKQCFGRQNYFVIDEDLFHASLKEKNLMSDLKNRIEGTIDYNEDIPLSIKKNVEKMLSDQLIIKEQKQSNDDEQPENGKISAAEQREIDSLTQKISKLKQRNEDLLNRFNEMEQKESQMKLEFLKKINQLRNEWEKKDLISEQERLENSKRRKQQFKELERKEKLLSEKKIADLNERIRLIEEQLLNDPDKRDELVQLQQQLIEEENNDIFIMSARRQKQIDEDRQEEMKFEEKKTNKKIMKMEIIKELDDKIHQSVEIKEESESKHKSRKPDDKDDVQANPSNANEISTGTKSKTCILL